MKEQKAGVSWNRMSKGKKAAVILCSLVLAGVISFTAGEQAILLKMRTDLEREYAGNYAILRLNIGGRPYTKPALWHMVRPLWLYRFTDNYEPEGTGHYTGKQNYLAMLVSDNRVIRLCHWSFREFALIYFEEPATCDVIKNLLDEEGPRYLFNASKRVKKRGLWFRGEGMNDEATNWYYREVREGVEPLWPAEPDFSGEEFLRKLKEAVASDDPKAVAACVRFPVTVAMGGFWGNKRRDVNREEFIRRYGDFVSEDVRAAILNEKPEDVFHNWEGWMIGRGEVWFTNTGIVAINQKVQKRLEGLHEAR